MANPGLLAALLKTGRLTGVLRWKVDFGKDEIAIEESASGFKAFSLDTSGVSELSEFFAVASKQLGVVATDFGSFESALRSLNNEQPIFIVWSGWEQFVKNNYEDAFGIANIFDDVAPNWPGAVLVVGKNGKFRDLAELAGV